MLVPAALMVVALVLGSSRGAILGCTILSAVQTTRLGVPLGRRRYCLDPMLILWTNQVLTTLEEVADVVANSGATHCFRSWSATPCSTVVAGLCATAEVL